MIINRASRNFSDSCFHYTTASPVSVLRVFPTVCLYLCYLRNKFLLIEKQINNARWKSSRRDINLTKLILFTKIFKKWLHPWPFCFDYTAIWKQPLTLKDLCSLFPSSLIENRITCLFCSTKGVFLRKALKIQRKSFLLMKGICDSVDVPDGSTNHRSVIKKGKKSTCHMQLRPIGNADQWEAVMQCSESNVLMSYQTWLLPMGQAHKLAKTQVLDSHWSGSQSRSTS